MNGLQSNQRTTDSLEKLEKLENYFLSMHPQANVSKIKLCLITESNERSHSEREVVKSVELEDVFIIMKKMILKNTNYLDYNKY